MFLYLQNFTETFASHGLLFPTPRVARFLLDEDFSHFTFLVVVAFPSLSEYTFHSYHAVLLMRMWVRLGDL